MLTKHLTELSCFPEMLLVPPSSVNTNVRHQIYHVGSWNLITWYTDSEWHIVCCSMQLWTLQLFLISFQNYFSCAAGSFLFMFKLINLWIYEPAAKEEPWQEPGWNLSTLILLPHFFFPLLLLFLFASCIFIFGHVFHPTFHPWQGKNCSSCHLASFTSEG